MTRTASRGPAEGSIPPRLLPVLYFGFAHLSLLTAFAATAAFPAELAGFFYHPRLAGIVHLVTLGWITGSILGSLYVIGPMALRTPMPARAADYAAFGVFVAGVTGLAAHLTARAFEGLGWAAALVLPALAVAAWRFLRGALRAPIQPGVRVHLAFAFLNLFAAATLGILMGFDWRYGFLPGTGLSNVAAHFHLAAAGCAMMMVVGTGYRLLPMVLPAVMPSAGGLAASALLIEAGVVGLAVTLLAPGPGGAIFALLIGAGLAVFARHLLGMIRNPRPAPPGLPRPDIGVIHVALALGCLAVSYLLGCALLLVPQSETSLRLVPVYGFLALVGFLSQMVVGMEARILPMFSGYHANRSACGTIPPVTPHEMPLRAAQIAGLILWSAGIPVLAAGLFAGHPVWIGTGGWILLGGAICNTASTARVLRYAWKAPVRENPSASSI
jgi:hypothetical protein